MIERIRLLPVDEQGFIEQEKRLLDVKEVLHDQMVTLAKAEQMSIQFLNRFSDLIDSASPDEIAGLLGVCTGVFELIESLGEEANDNAVSTRTISDDTEPIRRIKRNSTEDH